MEAVVSVRHFGGLRGPMAPITKRAPTKNCRSFHRTKLTGQCGWLRTRRWSSFGYHLSNGIICGYIDKFSMLLAAWLVSGLMIDELIEFFLLKKNTENKHLHNIIRGITWSLFLSIFWIIIVLEFKKHIPLLFEIMFTIPLIISVTCFIIMKYKIPQLFYGINLILIGSICWISTEIFCDKYVFFRWFPGHVIWHICMSFGLMHCLVYVILLRANNFNSNVISSKCSFLCIFFPILKFKFKTNSSKIQDISYSITPHNNTSNVLLSSISQQPTPPPPSPIQ